MLTYAVICPRALSESLLSNRAYLENCESLLHSATQQENTIVLVDAAQEFREALIATVRALPTAQGQYLQMYLESMLSGPRVRLANCRVVATRENTRPMLKLLGELSKVKPCDGVWVADPTDPEVMKAQINPRILHAIANFRRSDFETQRLAYKSPQKSLDELAGGEFDDLITRCVLYSRWLRFYDRQIGLAAGQGNIRVLKEYARGVEYIIRIWWSVAMVSKKDVQIITLAPKPDHAHSFQIQENRKALALVNEHVRIPIEKLCPQATVQTIMKFGSELFHARYLESELTAVSFDRGFDFLKKNGSFKHNLIRLDDNQWYLSQVQGLKSFAG